MPATSYPVKPRCTRHRWDVEKWLPVIVGADIETPHITCLNCGRTLEAKDTSPNMRAAIADGIAKNIYAGDEYGEVHHAVYQYFNHHLAIFQGG